MWDQDFRVTNDLEASQLIKTMEEEERESKRLLENVKQEIMMLEQAGDSIEEKYNKIKERVIFLLERYVEEEVLEEDIKETKTQKKYSLARGDVIVKKPVKKILKPNTEDEPPLMERYPQYVENKPILKWKDMKESFKINEDGSVVDKKTNKIIEGIKVIEEKPETTIKLKL